MEYNLIITALLISAFILCVNAYCLGLKHGKKLKEGKAIEPIRPLRQAVELVKNVKKGKLDKDIDKTFDEIESLFNYSGDVAMEALKKERR